MEPGNSRPEKNGGEWRLWLLGLFAAMCGLWAYLPTLSRIVASWYSDPDYSHGYLVVPFALLFLWLRRSTRPRVEFGFYPAGLILLAVAGLLRYLAGRLYLPELDAWSIPLWVGGVCWTVLGWSTVRWALPSIAFLWFATPLPATIALAISVPLQKLAAQGSGIAIQLMGHPAIVEGTTILLGDQTLEVERTCSGLRMFYGISALAVATILVTRPSRWTSLIILVAIVPVAIFVNVLRITCSGLLASHLPTETARQWTHDLAGVFVVPLAILVFAGLLWLLGRVRHSWRDNPQRTSRWLFGGFATCLVAALACVWWYGVQREKALTMLIALASRSEEKGDWSAAAEYLNRYIVVRPDDTDQLVHLAETLLEVSTAPAAKLRAAELLRIAYEREPQRRDLAVKAVGFAAEAQNFRMAMDLIGALQKSSGELDDELLGIRADVLLQYLNSPQGGRQTDYTWADVSAALEETVARPEYLTRRAAALAVVTREFLMEPAEEDRIARADAIINRLVADHPEDAYAWFTRYRYARHYGADEDSKDIDADLDQAVEKCGRALPEEQVEILLAAAELRRREGSFDVVRELLQRAIRAQPAAAQPYLALADLERRAGGTADLWPSIDVLRTGFQATEGQSLELAFALAEALAEVGNDAESRQVLEPIRAALSQVVDGAMRGYLTLGIARVETTQHERRAQTTKAASTLQTALDLPGLELAVAGGGTTDKVEGAWRRLGRLYGMLGWHDQALEAYRQAARLNPESPTSHQALADAALAAGDVETAIKENLRRVKQDANSGDAWVALAVAQLQQQLRLPPARRNLSDASRSLAQAWQLPAAKIPLLLASVDQLRAQSRWSEAQKLLDNSLAQDSEQPELWKALAIVQLDQSNHAAALEAAEQFAAHDGSLLEAATLQASVLMAAGRGEEAVQRLERARARLTGREQLKASLSMAALRRKLGDQAAAHSILEAVHREHPQELGAVERLARYASDDRDWKQLAKWEIELKELEGAEGTLWKAYRVTRLLADERQPDGDRLREANELARQISNTRPQWATSQYLLAQVALRTGDTEEAIYRLERTWRTGERSAKVADQLLDLLHQVGRSEDADRFAEELGDVPLSSPGLFDRLLPQFFRKGQSNQAVAQAQQWAKDSPDDAEAFVRLGRTLLIGASTLANIADQSAQLHEAEKAFRTAVQLAPADATTWTSLYTFLLQSRRPQDAVELLARFDREVELEPVDKELLLAKLNGVIPRPAQAIRHWRRAVGPAGEHADRDKRVLALSQAAQFFAAPCPSLAERYCREALELDPAATEPLELLANLLASHTEPEAIAEAITLTQRLSDGPGAQPIRSRRLMARLLTLRNSPGDADEVIGLLEALSTKGPDDKLLLAQNYARVGRPGAAYDVLDDVASAPKPRAVDLISFLESWQEHFQAEGHFTNRARDVATRLGQLPQGLPEQLRWEMRLAQAAAEKSSANQPAIESVLTEFWTTQPAAQALASDESSQSLLYGVLRVLLEEGHVNEAVELCRRPPGKIAPQFAARLLANTLMAHRLEDADQVSAGEKRLDEVLSENPNDVLLLQDTADLAALSGNRERAEETYNRVLMIDPNHRNASRNLATLLSDDPQRTADALTIVDETLAVYPDDGLLIDAKGEILLKMGRAQEAIAVLMEAANKEPLSAPIYLHLAMAHEQLGESSEVEEALLTAITLGIDQLPIAGATRQALVELRNEYKL